MPTPKSVCFITNNTYSASFNGAQDAAYTAKYGHPPEMKRGRGKEGEGEREREGEGGDGWPLRGKGVERGGRKEREGGMGTNPYSSTVTDPRGGIILNKCETE